VEVTDLGALVCDSALAAALLALADALDSVVSQMPVMLLLPQSLLTSSATSEMVIEHFTCRRLVRPTRTTTRSLQSNDFNVLAQRPFPPMLNA
jgi:hypothetical protein